MSISQDARAIAELKARVLASEQTIASMVSAFRQNADVLVEMQNIVRQLHASNKELAELAKKAMNPFVNEGDVYPPVGRPIDFWDEDFARSCQFYQGEDTFERLKLDTLPMPPLENNEGYGKAENHGFLFYWLFGLDDYLRTMAACKTQGIDVRKVFDFGGSTGRVFRQFYCQDGPKEVWSSDFKVQSVNWCLQYLPTDIRVFLNSTVPTLPIPTGYFDLVTAFSVFSHVDELETAWLMELKRILRPGGMAYITIHDDVTWEKHTAGMLVDLIRKSPNGATIPLGGQMPRERLVFKFSEQSHYNCNTFFSRDYIRKQWGRYFDIEIIPQGHASVQSVVLCMNR